MKQAFIPLCCLILFAVACKSGNDKPGLLESMGNLKKMADNVVTESKKSTDRWEERKAKGDTTAIPYKDLEAYLPQISGYTSSEGPKGSQMNTPGLGSWSQGEQDYTNGDKRVN
ncbi:MAG: hypothetical protein ABI687_04145, partial [Flavitalea sp.]